MKRCPYCAEEIQDAAIKCRWCGSDLTVPADKVVAHPPREAAASSSVPSEAPPGAKPSPEEAAPAAARTPATQQPAAEPGGGRTPEILSPPRTPSPNANLTFSHEGPRYLLGYTAQYYGIWDKQTPGPPTNRFPRTDEGWQEAWEAFIKAEMGQT